ncbi:SAM-dependent methyltransferase [Actibacterium sp. 188UL27-1]|uniref:SAM-dependent methyltransferase n=1 Tax=Actibacterium sp. 188UL27-1 TaxID=2786961 RepID=UPI00195930EE|nr:SAM-dependent methyltransferase [Actibacterium sp. 188UL27-1]MBM7067296.1 SAM-dependent methyltransferase [Actibacterium sp. 188UL27-1]
MTGLTDRPQLKRFRARAHRAGHADFLHRAVRAELQERLSEVNKTFKDLVVVAGFIDLWRELWPSAPIILDDDVLDLAVAQYDLVIHAMSLHWADDPVGQLIQSRRALRPDGLFLGSLLGGETLATLRNTLAEAEVALTGGLSPRIAPMAEIRDIGGLMQRAGFAMPVADTLPFTVSYEGLPHLLHDLRAMGEGNALSTRHRQPPPRSLFVKAAELYPKQSDGRIVAEFEIIFLTGWAPADSQPQPLRPGSAQSRLADVLGGEEVTMPGTSSGRDRD